MPEITRSVPAYEQIADHYRTLIRSGQLKPGTKLPSVTDLAEEWHVSRSTSAQAIGRLQTEHIVHTSTQGTFVSAEGIVTPTPADNVRTMQPHRVGPNETVQVTAVEIVTPPDYVADVFDVAPGTQVIRREEITTLHGKPQMLSVDWILADSTLTALGALEAKPLRGGTAHFIETNTHRKITYGQDHIRARSADAREAAALQIAIGAPILAGVHSWSDEKGSILYGEWVIPPDRVISYRYEVTKTPKQ